MSKLIAKLNPFSGTTKRYVAQVVASAEAARAAGESYFRTPRVPHTLGVVPYAADPLALRRQVKASRTLRAMDLIPYSPRVDLPEMRGDIEVWRHLRRAPVPDSEAAARSETTFE